MASIKTYIFQSENLFLKYHLQIFGIFAQEPMGHDIVSHGSHNRPNQRDMKCEEKIIFL